MRPPAALAPATGAGLAALPGLAASLLFAGAATGAVGLDSRRLAGVGLALVAACLLVTAVRRPVATAALSVALALSLTAPALALAAPLAALALADPVMIVVTPAVVALAAALTALVIGWAAVLAVRPGDVVAPLATIGLPLIWLPAFAAGATEPAVWSALAWTFALAALMCYAAVACPPRYVLAVAAAGVGLACLVTLGRAPTLSPLPTGAAVVATGMLALAGTAGLAPIGLGVAARAAGWWSGRRGAASRPGPGPRQ